MNDAREPDEIGVTLCVYGENLVPAQISDMLGCDASCSHTRGEKKGPHSPAFPEGAWLLEERRFAPCDPNEMVETLFLRMSSDEAVWKELSSKYRIRVHLAVHTEQGICFDLSQSNLALIAARHAEMFVDIYAYDG